MDIRKNYQKLACAFFNRAIADNAVTDIAPDMFELMLFLSGIQSGAAVYAAQKKYREKKRYTAKEITGLCGGDNYARQKVKCLIKKLDIQPAAGTAREFSAADVNRIMQHFGRHL